MPSARAQGYGRRIRLLRRHSSLSKLITVADCRSRYAKHCADVVAAHSAVAASCEQRMHRLSPGARSGCTWLALDHEGRKKTEEVLAKVNFMLAIRAALQKACGKSHAFARTIEILWPAVIAMALTASSGEWFSTVATCNRTVQERHGHNVYQQARSFVVANCTNCCFELLGTSHCLALL